MPPSAVLLGVCYDKGKLTQRMDVLQGTPLVGVPASSRATALEAMHVTHIDIMVLCAQLPEEDRQLLSAEFKRVNGGPVLWVLPRARRKSKLVDAIAREDQPEEIRAAIMTLLAARPFSYAR